MWRNHKALSCIGASLGLGIGSFYLKSGTLRAESFQELNNRLSNCPFLVWDHDWDGRAPKKKGKDGKEQIDSTKFSKYSRTIWLINDVQHHRDEDDANQEPTTVGLRQLQKLAEMLKKIMQTQKLKWDNIYHSTILRSRAQAIIIGKNINSDVKLKGGVGSRTAASDRNAMVSLVEGVPSETSPILSDAPCVSPDVIFQDRPRVESIFASIFHRANSNQKADSHDIVVAHPNVIRYLICRALQMPPEAFSRFHIFHASISRIRINGDGSVVVEILGDAGYLPNDLLSSGELEGAPPVLLEPNERPNEEIVNRIARVMKAVEAYQDNTRNIGRHIYNCPYLKWDYNWDNNQRYKVVNGEKSLDGSKDSKFSRTIWLVNDVEHYRNDDDLEQKPTSIGILQGSSPRSGCDHEHVKSFLRQLPYHCSFNDWGRGQNIFNAIIRPIRSRLESLSGSQGKLCAAILHRLMKSGYKWDSAYHSTMLRTVFQANEIKKALKDKDLSWKVCASMDLAPNDSRERVKHDRNNVK